MKRVAIICPVSLQETYSTNTHLVLSQYYKSIPEYREFFLKRRQRGDFIILDNGAAELKKSVQGLSVIDITRELKPTLVVAPDVIYNKNATITLTEQFLRANWLELQDLGVKVMAVPQGETPEEWLECYKRFNSDPHVAWLGISMFYTPKFTSRLEVLKRIAPTVKKPCHLLGLWNDPFGLLEERKFDFVQSVDTAKPVEYAIEGIKLEDWAKHKHIDDDWYFTEAGKVFGPDTTKEDVSELYSLIMANTSRFIKLFTEGAI